MENEKKEEDLNLINDLNEIEEVKNNEIENEINKDEKVDEDLLISNDNDYDKDDENVRLIKESERQLQAKRDLIEVFDEIASYLNKNENIPRSITEIYDIYIDNEFITKSHIRNVVNECLLKFMFFVVGPIYGIIFLIGIFQIKSLMNAFLELIKRSFIDYYRCYFRSNCQIELIENGENVYDFYYYYYTYSMNEKIDFNLMMITGFIGNIFIKWIGFKFTTGILCLFTFGSILWVLNFDFNFKEMGVFDYDFLKLLNILFIYILFLLGIGSSSLLSHQILIESHLKYKDYLINNMRNQYLNKNQKDEKINNINLDLNINDNNSEILIKSQNLSIQNIDINDDKEANFDESNTKFSKKITDEQKQKRLEERINKKRKNKFDFFFMISIITIIGYLGKYGMNFFLDYTLKNLIYKDENYDKRLFMLYTMGLYAVSLIFSVLLYQLFKMSIFEYDQEKGNKNNKAINISQICGYIIYTEKKKPKIPAKKNCCRLCFESQQNCCNETFCYLLSIIQLGDCCNCYCCYDCCDCCECCECWHDLNDRCTDCCTDFSEWLDNPNCYCSCLCKECKYDPDDYGKKEEVFRYCYKAERKCLWCNKFMTNDTQKKIFPYMFEYFILQLTTIGFEKHYEINKNQNEHKKTWIAVFIGTFIFFFYFTLSFTKFYSDGDKDEIENDKGNEIEKDDEKEKRGEKKNNAKKAKNRKEMISKLSNDILNGTHGIVLFNSVFSIIFSSLYLSNISDNIKKYIFEDNINIIFIPILMNKFYYFTLNYYCIYTAEKNNKFELISTSSLVSFYIIIWNLALTLVKSSIPDENKGDSYNYFNILYIIQIIFDSIPSLLVVGYILIMLALSTGLINYISYDCDDCQDCRDNFFMHKYIFCFCSFFLCFGGLWMKIDNDGEFKCECCNVGDCCDIGDSCCNVYCFEDNIYCDCCCCSRNSSCFSDGCDKNCNTCKICC